MSKGPVMCPQCRERDTRKGFSPNRVRLCRARRSVDPHHVMVSKSPDLRVFPQIRTDIRYGRHRRICYLTPTGHLPWNRFSPIQPAVMVRLYVPCSRYCYFCVASVSRVRTSPGGTTKVSGSVEPANSLTIALTAVRENSSRFIATDPRIK
jgi:hypothetical protein